MSDSNSKTRAMTLDPTATRAQIQDIKTVKCRLAPFTAHPSSLLDRFAAGTQLGIAIVEADINRVQEILGAHPGLQSEDVSRSNPTKCAGHKTTPLHIAGLAGGDSSMIASLATGLNSTDINRLDFMSRSPLHCACLAGHLETAKALIACGVDPHKIRPVYTSASTNGPIVTGYSSCDLACMGIKPSKFRHTLSMAEHESLLGSEHEEIRRMLCSDHGVSHTLLYFSWIMGSGNGSSTHFDGADRHLNELPGHLLSEVLELRQHMMDADREWSDESIQQRQCILTSRIADVLTQHPEYVSKPLPRVTVLGPGCRPSALHLAAREGHLAATKALVEQWGADKELKLQWRWPHKGETPLHAACVGSAAERPGRVWGPVFGDKMVSPPQFHDGHAKVVKYLVQKHADVNSVSGQCRTPLHLACENGAKDIVEILLQAGARHDVSSGEIWEEEEHRKCPRGLPFMHALMYGELECALLATPRSRYFAADAADRQVIATHAGLLHIGWTGLIDNQYVSAYRWIGEELLASLCDLESCTIDSDAKKALLTCIGNSYAFAEANPNMALQCFELITQTTSKIQHNLPAKLHNLAVELGVAVPPLKFQPPSARLYQHDIFSPLSGHGEMIISEGLLPKYTVIRDESIAEVEAWKQNRSFATTHWADTSPGVTPPCVESHEIMLTALCIVATFLEAKLQQTLNEKVGAMNSKNGTWTWPGPKTIERMLLKRLDYSDLENPCGGILDVLRLSLVTQDRAMQEELLNLLMHESYPTLTPIRSKSTMQDESAKVKMELWNFVFRPKGLTFGSMTGGSKTVEVKRLGIFGDISNTADFYEETPSQYQRAPRTIMQTIPNNKELIDAIDRAKKANTSVSVYVWAAATDLLCHPALAATNVAMICELQVYLDVFLAHRKLMHLPYKIDRSGGLLQLAQDCFSFSNAPELAYMPGREAMNRVISCDVGHGLVHSITQCRSRCYSCSNEVPVSTRMLRCLVCDKLLCMRCHRQG